MPSKKVVYIFTLLGLLLGFTLDFMIRYENTRIFYYALICLFSLLYALAYDEKNLLRLVVSSLVIALFLSISLLPLQSSAIPKNLDHWITFLCAFPLFVYVGHSFHYAYHHDNTWRISYSSLFAAVWNTIPLLFIGVLFSGLANLLILLGAFILKTVGSDYLWTLYFNNQHFQLISNVTLFYIGLGIGQQNINIIYNLRFLMLRMMYYLFPCLALISALYFVLYLGHSATNGDEYINPLVILIPLTSLGIIFFNAYFQDGNVEAGAPAWLQVSLRMYRVILFLLVLMMIYRIFRTNSLDINVVIYLLATIFFSLTYAVTTAFTGGMEQKWVHIGNISTALFFIIALFLLNLPYMPIAFNVGAQAPPQIITNQP